MDTKHKYGVFIVESLTLDDEKNGLLDGQILRDILDLCQIPNEYYYIRTSHELQEIINEFDKSEFRYLHLSCHADKTQIAFTFEELFFYEVAELIKSKLKNKRVFISACEACNFEFAKTLIPSSGCYSLIGSPTKINFDKSAVFWSGFYHLMNETNNIRMGQPEIRTVLQKLVDTYDIPINYYSFISNNNSELKENLLRPNIEIKSTKKTVFDNEA
ncbi:MAG: hypothetical protein ACMVP2_22810 [Imperialibacter sp.]|uniref:hypothetical protein n=1 Tax=Imperialibacter sp. TaxID=2038411 RepID=UPI003A887009